MGRKGLRRSWDEGATAVESAIVLSLLFMLVFGILEFGMALWQWQTMELVVLQEGRNAMVNNLTITATAANNNIQNMLPGAAISCPLPSSPAAPCLTHQHTFTTRTDGTEGATRTVSGRRYCQVKLSGSEKAKAACAITLRPPHSAIRSPPRLERSAALIARRDGVER